MAKESFSTAEQFPKTLLLGVHLSQNILETPEHHFEEFRSLVKTFDTPYDQEMYIKLRSTDKGYFLTKGKLEDVAELCQKENIERVICSKILTPLQERNLETLFNCEVFDREQLILEIFRKSANSSEGRIQVEMARMEFLKTRLAGKGKDFAQQEGRVGSRGPGETNKEKLRRFFEDRLRQAKKRLEALARSRGVQRKQRLESRQPLVCLVGYTNAGKSSILNKLTKSDVLAEDKLFATLDTTTRELFFETRKVLVSDTVGFISELPAHLIQAFKSTLDELKFAHLLVHVIDASNPAWKNHVQVVNQTLEELEVHAPVVHVFNKIDLFTEKEILELEKEMIAYEPHLFVHTKSKEGLLPLLNYLKTYKF